MSCTWARNARPLRAEAIHGEGDLLHRLRLHFAERGGDLRGQRLRLRAHRARGMGACDWLR